MDTRVNTHLTTDADGFVSQECPACRRRFKVIFERGGGRVVSFCPYCGHRGRDCWWTPEQVTYFKSVVTASVVAPMVEEFARDLRRLNRRGGWISFDAKLESSPRARQPMETSLRMPVAVFECCNEKVKHDGSARRLRCIICGADKPL